MYSRACASQLSANEEKYAVLGKNRFAVHVLLHLDQEAPSADEDVERVEGLRFVELFGFQVGFAKR